MERPDLYIYGLYYGYPKCCINSFITNFGNADNASRFDVSNGTGFIPCEKHAQMIRNNKCTLESLISPNRLCQINFPNNCTKSYEEVVEIIYNKLKKDV